jgi:putative hydroxymethylpyrimidine transport system permease protein
MTAAQTSTTAAGPAAPHPGAPTVPPARSRGERALAVLRTYMPAILLTIATIVVWELFIQILEVEQYLFPAPTDIANALAEDPQTFAEEAWFTIKEIVLGFAIAVIAGLGIAIALHMSGLLRQAVFPILITSQTIPMVVLAPIFVILMGFGMAPKLAIVGLICFFPIVVNTVDGLRSVDPAYIKMMRTLDASRMAIFRRVEFPAALPMIFTGARIGATYAAIGAVLGEWSGSTGGIGYLIQQNVPSLNTPAVFGGIVVLSAISLTLFGLVTLVERLTIPWARD